MEEFIMPTNNNLENKLLALENELVIDFVRSGGAGGRRGDVLTGTLTMPDRTRNTADGHLARF